MKKIIALGTLLTLLITSVSAQDLLFSAKLKKEEIPAVVITSMESDYPGMEITSYNAIPLEFIGEDWIVHPNTSAFANKDYDTYIISFSGQKLKGEATYDSDGNLISARENIKNIPLPHSIQKSIATNFPDWTVNKDHEIFTINREGQKKIYYKIELAKGKEVKKVVYDGNANEIKVGRMHHQLG